MTVFGTDGLRDSVEGPLLEPRFVQRFARGLARWAKQRHSDKAARLHAIIGRDTRGSGEAIFHHLAQGLGDEGIGVLDGGICPTPAVATAVRDLNLELGLVITASHNPASDNGIKVFGSSGAKLSDASEREIEAEIAATMATALRVGGTPVRQYEARRHYLEALAGILPEGALMGLSIVVDASNGATFQTTAELLAKLGARITRIHHTPDGANINADCGSEHPASLQATVLETTADLGIAHDGDGDRVILCDHAGEVINGDALLALLALHWAKQGWLTHGGLVATVMSNLALDATLRQHGIHVHRAGVGDRQVFFKMRDLGLHLGGESSGHIISLRHLPTGDGLLAALLVLRAMTDTGQTLRDLASVYTPYPQLVRNLKVTSKPDLVELGDLQSALRDLEADLGDEGRLLLRYSGTEPKIRLLVEAGDPDRARHAMDRLYQIVTAHLPVI
jgi:phosphoglucosamine mutase